MGRRVAFIFGIDLSFSSLIGLCVCSFSSYYRNKVYSFEFFMPHIIPNAEDNHLCMKMLIRDNFYLVGFEPRGSRDTVHQMTLYGCAAPASNRTVWNCREEPRGPGEGARRGTRDADRPCLGEAQVVYSWGGEAAAARLRLPAGVGFLVGPDSRAPWLVLRAHYRRLRHPDGALVEIDESGVILNYTRKHMPRAAGVAELRARGAAPARAAAHLEDACVVRAPAPLHPLAVRAHTHRYGEVVSCFAVRQGATGDEWTALAKIHPLRTTNFVAVRKEAGAEPLRPGDLLAARCTLNNTGYGTVYPGSSEREAACAVHVLYWTEPAAAPAAACRAAGPRAPAYSWARDLHHFRNIPHLEASIL